MGTEKLLADGEVGPHFLVFFVFVRLPMPFPQFV